MKKVMNKYNNNKNKKDIIKKSRDKSKIGKIQFLKDIKKKNKKFKEFNLKFVKKIKGTNKNKNNIYKYMLNLFLNLLIKVSIGIFFLLVYYQIGEYSSEINTNFEELIKKIDNLEHIIKKMEIKLEGINKKEEISSKYIFKILWDIIHFFKKYFRKIVVDLIQILKRIF